MGHGPHALSIAGAQKPSGIVTGLQATVLRTPQGQRARLSVSEMTLPSEVASQMASMT